MNTNQRGRRTSSLLSPCGNSPILPRTFLWSVLSIDHSHLIFVLQASNDLTDDTYDTTYNSACVLLSSGQYVEAEAKLRKADSKKKAKQSGVSNFSS